MQAIRIFILQEIIIYTYTRAIQRRCWSATGSMPSHLAYSWVLRECVLSLECVLSFNTCARTTKRITSSGLMRESNLTREHLLCGLPESPLRRAQSPRECRPRSPPTSRSCARNPHFQTLAALFSLMRDRPRLWPANTSACWQASSRPGPRGKTRPTG